MRWHNPALLVACALALAACQGGSDDAEKAELEARVAELEEKLGETGDAETGSPGASTAPADRPSARYAEPERTAPADRSSARPAEPERAATASRARPADPPPAAEAPTPAPIELPRGTRLAVVLETPLSSKSNQTGDRVVARVAEATGPDGAIALPGGATVEGRVTEVARSGKVKGRARLVFGFDRIVLGGREHPLEATGLAIEADKDAKRDAVIVGGGAAAGAILGGITGGKKGAGKGAVLGGAAGAGAVLLTRGDEVELPAGYGFTAEVLSGVRF